MNWSGRRRGIERSDICDKGYDENVEIEKKKKDPTVVVHLQLCFCEHNS